MLMLRLLAMRRTDKELHQGLGTRVHGFFADSQLLVIAKTPTLIIKHYNKIVLIFLL